MPIMRTIRRGPKNAMRHFPTTTTDYLGRRSRMMSPVVAIFRSLKSVSDLGDPTEASYSAEIGCVSGVGMFRRHHRLVESLSGSLERSSRVPSLADGAAGPPP